MFTAFYSYIHLKFARSDPNPSFGWWFQAPDTLRVSFHALTAHINVLKPPSNPTKSEVNEPATERTQADCMCIPVAMWTITQVYFLKIFQKHKSLE